MSEDLNQLRDAIDRLDSEILQALAKRMQLSDQVIAAKKGAFAFVRDVRPPWCASLSPTASKRPRFVACGNFGGLATDYGRQP